MSSGVFEFFFIVVLILANGVFAMSEIAVISARKVRLKTLADEGNHKARVALNLADSPNLFLSTVQIGITLVSVLSGAFSGAFLADPLAGFLGRLEPIEPYSPAVALAVIVVGITYLSLVVGELVPKRLALNHPERIALFMAPFMKTLSRIAAPVVRLLGASTDLVLALVGMRPTSEPPVTEEEIRVLIDQATDAGVFEEAEQDMVERVFRLADRRVGILMTPRRKIKWLDLKDPLEKNRKRIIKSPFSRFPVSQERLGNLLGVVHVKDLLNRSLAGYPFDVKSCLKPPLFVLENMHVLKVLETFKETGHQMAIIVDEYGTVEGLVTLTDILEAIVGVIPSPDECEEPRVTEREDGSWLVDGMLPVDELKEIFDIRSIPGEKEGYFDTLGGLVMTYLGRIPAAGDSFEACGLRFEVVDMDGRRVDKVLIDRIQGAGGVEKAR